MFHLYFFMNDVLTVINIPLKCMHILDFISPFGAKTGTGNVFPDFWFYPLFTGADKL